jgi:voltage-gated potassium channel
MRIKKKIYHILDISQKNGDVSWWFDLFLVTLIVLNALAIVLESVESIRIAYKDAFYYFEVFSVIFFSVEYVLRLWTANEISRFKKPISGNLRYAFTPLALIDLLSVLPFYLPFMGVDLRLLRVLRLFRLLRLLKIVRYIKALSLINKVVKEKKEELAISTILTLFMLLIVSTIMYHVEHEAQPENFSSIPETMWWGIATLTTVGYGDVYPVTGLGKLLGGIIAILGIGLFALPTGILASGFSDHIAKNPETIIVCPNCGVDIEKE